MGHGCEWNSSLFDFEFMPCFWVVQSRRGRLPVTVGREKMGEGDPFLNFSMSIVGGNKLRSVESEGTRRSMQHWSWRTNSYFGRCRFMTKRTGHQPCLHLAKKWDQPGTHLGWLSDRHMLGVHNGGSWSMEWWLKRFNDGHCC